MTRLRSFLAGQDKLFGYLSGLENFGRNFALFSENEILVVRDTIEASYEVNPEDLGPTQFAKNVQKLVESTIANSELDPNDPNVVGYNILALNFIL